MFTKTSPLWKLLVRVIFCALVVVSVVFADNQQQWSQRYSRNMVSGETDMPETFDAATGKNIKWIVPLGTQTYSTPVVVSGKVLIGTSLCWQLVVPKLIPTLYRDWPRSGICSPATVEGNMVYIVSNRGQVMCLDTTRTGDITNSCEVWSYPLERHCCSTPSICDGLVFVADCGRMLHCVDAETGQPYWTHQTKGEIWASTLVADGKVYIGTRRGDFWVLAASKKKRVISSIKLDGPMHGSPIAANGVLYIATMKKLYAVKKSCPTYTLGRRATER